MSEIISEQKVEESALTKLVRSNAGSVQGFEEGFSDALIFVHFFMNSSVSVVKNCSESVKRSAVCKSEFIEKILD